MTKIKLQGAVLLIGSLLWENEDNALNLATGKKRREWRKALNLQHKIKVQVPIRYGRRSSSRKCTYTMAFANSATRGESFIAPYREMCESNDHLKSLAIELARAEGIVTKRDQSRIWCGWGAVGVMFHEVDNERAAEWAAEWAAEFDGFDNSSYNIGDEEPSITNRGFLNFPLDIPDGIDFVLATPVKPQISEYPTPSQIADAIIETQPRYDTYVRLNYRSGIRVSGDDDVIARLDAAV